MGPDVPVGAGRQVAQDHRDRPVRRLQRSRVRSGRRRVRAGTDRERRRRESGGNEDQDMGAIAAAGNHRVGIRVRPGAHADAGRRLRRDCRPVPPTLDGRESDHRRRRRRRRGRNAPAFVHRDIATPRERPRKVGARCRPAGLPRRWGDHGGGGHRRVDGRLHSDGSWRPGVPRSATATSRSARPSRRSTFPPTRIVRGSSVSSSRTATRRLW